MISGIFLSLLLSMSNGVASSPAKPSASKIKTKNSDKDEKTQRASPAVRREEHQRIEKIKEVLPDVPKELVGIVGEYAKHVDPVITTMLAENNRLHETLRYIYTVIWYTRPSRAKLAQTFADGQSDELLREIWKRVIDSVTPFIEIQDEIYGKWKNLTTQYYDRWAEYGKFIAAKGIMLPYGNTTQKKWQEGGFQPKAQLYKLSQMTCSSCKATILYPFPWMEPQYYHLSGCAELAKLQKVTGSYRIIRFGQEIPQDEEANLKYMALYFDKGSRGHGVWTDFWRMVTHLPIFIAFAEYVWGCEVLHKNPEEVFRDVRKRLRDFYKPLEKMGPIYHLPHYSQTGFNDISELGLRIFMALLPERPNPT